MALAQLKSDPFADDAPARRSPYLSAVEGLAVAGPSPAHVLQDRIERAHAADPAQWSPRQSVALIVTASFALWGALLTAAAHVAHAVV